jgi:osmotically-inducible protein OsmY
MKKIAKLFFLIMWFLGFALVSCAGETDPLAGEGQSNFQYYLGFGGAYSSSIADLESKRLSADIQRKISKSDIEALKSGGTILLVGSVASRVDIETARAVAITEYSDDSIINKLHSDIKRSDKQLLEDNMIADKLAKLLEQQKISEIKICCFNNQVYMLYAKTVDAKKLDIVTKAAKSLKNVKKIQQITY